MSDRQKKNRFLLGACIGAVLVMMALYWRCSGRGSFGITNSEQTVAVPSSQNDSKTEQPRPPCELRMDSEGLKLDGKTIELDVAVVACKKPGKANLFITGGASHAQLQDILATLKRAGVQVTEQRKRPD